MLDGGSGCGGWVWWRRRMNGSFCGSWCYVVVLYYVFFF